MVGERVGGKMVSLQMVSLQTLNILVMFYRSYNIGQIFGSLFIEKNFY